jgi:ArsR family transcriptional regulator, virulence genes transcriptional regulator
MKLRDMEATAERVSEIMKLLANKHRLLVLCQLADGEKSVGELARLLGVREPAMSQQLAVLRREGLIRPRREAQTIYYEVARDDIRRLMEFLYETYCGSAAGEGVDDVTSDLETDQRRERQGVA